MTKEERLLLLSVRTIGTFGLSAFLCALMPYAWMNAVHRWLGMGPLPDAPVVGYLARSASALYAILGGLLWVCSFDLRRFRPVLCYFGAAAIVFGLLLFGIDWSEGMPLWWRLGEGPATAAMGLVVLLLSRRVGLRSDETGAPAQEPAGSSEDAIARH